MPKITRQCPICTFAATTDTALEVSILLARHFRDMRDEKHAAEYKLELKRMDALLAQSQAQEEIRLAVRTAPMQSAAQQLDATLSAVRTMVSGALAAGIDALAAALGTNEVTGVIKKKEAESLSAELREYYLMLTGKFRA